MKTRIRHYEYMAADKDRNWREGWRPVNVPDTFYPGTGFLSAHDAIEHLSNKTDFEHECRAFGVVVFGRIRVEPKQMIQNAGNDLGNFLKNLHESGELVKIKRPPQRWLDHRLPDRDERNLKALLQETKGVFFSVDLGFVSIDRHDMSQAELKVFNDAAEKIAGWARLGFRGAERVYGKDSAKKLYNMLFDLSRAVDIQHDGVRPVPGDKLTITIRIADMDGSLQYEKGEHHDAEKAKMQRRMRRELVDALSEGRFSFN